MLKKRKLPALGSILSLLKNTVGLLARLAVSMFQIARGSALAFTLSLGIALVFAFGFYGLFTYAIPLSKSEVRVAMVSKVADRTEVLLNGAAHDYDAGNIQEAVKVLELALEQLVSKTGQYNRLDGWKLERVYFLLAKCYDRLDTPDKAIQNYEETLRLNPDHLPAKYNLERLQAKGGGDKGGKQPQPDKGKPQPKI